MTECCKKCGGEMISHSWSPSHCEYALEEDWWYSEPDSGPYYCNYEEEEEEEEEEDTSSCTLQQRVYKYLKDKWAKESEEEPLGFQPYTMRDED